MRILELAFRYAMPVLIFITMGIGFVIGHELAVLILDPSPWSFIYNVMSGLLGTVGLSFALVKASRAYFSKQFEQAMTDMGLSPGFVFEEAGNGVAIDLEKGKFAVVEQGIRFALPLSSIRQLESGWDQKNKMNKRVMNNTLHIYTSSKENSLITVSYGMNAGKRDQAVRQLEASMATSEEEKSTA